MCLRWPLWIFGPAGAAVGLFAIEAEMKATSCDWQDWKCFPISIITYAVYSYGKILLLHGSKMCMCVCVCVYVFLSVICMLSQSVDVHNQH